MNELLDRYERWRSERTDLSERDTAPGGVAAGEWQRSDDTACELLDAAIPYVRAVASLVNLDPGVWLDEATRFTCTEANAVAALLNTAGADDVATTFLKVHTLGDDDGDLHYLDGDVVKERPQ